jgi:hypothetical protein
MSQPHQPREHAGIYHPSYCTVDGTHVHIQHCPIKFFPRHCLLRRTALLFQGTFAAFPLLNVLLSFAIDGSKNVKQSALKRGFVERLESLDSILRSSKGDISKSFAFLREWVEGDVNLGKTYKTVSNLENRRQGRRNKVRKNYQYNPYSHQSRKSDVPIRRVSSQSAHVCESSKIRSCSHL